MTRKYYQRRSFCPETAIYGVLNHTQTETHAHGLYGLKPCALSNFCDVP